MKRRKNKIITIIKPMPEEVAYELMKYILELAKKKDAEQKDSSTSSTASPSQALRGG